MNFRIRKRPWYGWLMWLIWVIWLGFWTEVTIGSCKEMEYRAFTLSLIILLASFLIGVVFWILRNRRFKIKMRRY